METKSKAEDAQTKINIAKSHDARCVLEQLIETNKWTEATVDPDITWITGPLTEEDIEEVRDTKTLISRYPMAHAFARKKELSILLEQMRKYFPDDYTFYPRTYLYPEDKVRFDAVLDKNNGPNKKTFILKPSIGTQGKGIRLFQTRLELVKGLSESKSKEWIIQEYIDKPMLLDGKKFDLRVYVLLVGVNPMQCFVCNEGLARFCTV